MSITIDSTIYSVGITSLNRNAEVLFKYAERTDDGTLHAEAIGTYYNFDVQMGQSKDNLTDYAALWVKLTDPNHEHEITMPDGANGSLTFNCYFSSISDVVKKWYDSGDTYYRELTFSVIAISPARTP